MQGHSCRSHAVTAAQIPKQDPEPSAGACAGRGEHLLWAVASPGP